jgi:hypothetical protein
MISLELKNKEDKNLYPTIHVNQIYPVGSIYMTADTKNPGELFGGIWERFARGRTIIGLDEDDIDFNSLEKVGGGKTSSHTHSLVNHTHSNPHTGNTSVDHTHPIPHTHNNPNTNGHAITIAQMPSHGHSFCQADDFFGQSTRVDYRLGGRTHTEGASTTAGIVIQGSLFRNVGRWSYAGTLWINNAGDGATHTHSLGATHGTNTANTGNQSVTHNHTIANTGNPTTLPNTASISISILQPYIVVNIWKRVS